MMILARASPASFKLLKEDAALTPGNLNAHLRALEEAGYVEALPGFVDLKPRTRYAITATGREALRRYCAALEEILRRYADDEKRS